jgi:hypothetical protein
MIARSQSKLDKSLQDTYVSELRAALPAALAKSGAKLDKATLDRLALHLGMRIARKDKLSARRTPPRRRTPPASTEWISTQGAADLSGFSRPFVAALLDSGAYDGEIHRTPKGGHRKVKADEFKAWLDKSSKTRTPKTIEQARAEAVLSPIAGEATPDKASRAESRERAAALAKRLGIA